MASLTDCLFYYKGNCVKMEMEYNPLTHVTLDDYLNSGPDGENLSADDVVNIKKEPIAIDLQVGKDESPDRRIVRQLPVQNLERRIPLPKNYRDLYYLTCEEDFHIKTPTEIHRERGLHNQYHWERQKQFEKLADFANRPQDLRPTVPPLVNSTASSTSQPQRRLTADGKVVCSNIQQPSLSTSEEAMQDESSQSGYEGEWYQRGELKYEPSEELLAEIMEESDDDEITWDDE